MTISARKFNLHVWNCKITC